MEVIYHESFMRSSLNISVHFHTNVRQVTAEHTHDFYEIFFLLDGIMRHRVNGAFFTLKKGDIVFMRPDDRHTFVLEGKGVCSFINISFSREMADSLFDYLDNAAVREAFLESPMPPCGYLDEEESAAFNRRLKNALSREGTVGDSVLRARMKLLLAGLFYDGFMQDRYTDQPPEWMLDLCREYEEKQLFVEGYAALVRLSGKTTAYLSRCFRRYYHTTPTGYVNFLRVGLAASLLEEEELRIIDICYRCGFDNTSNFYLYFKERYGMSPGEYRAHVFAGGKEQNAPRET